MLLVVHLLDLPALIADPPSSRVQQRDWFTVIMTIDEQSRVVQRLQAIDRHSWETSKALCSDRVLFSQLISASGIGGHS